ncbi:MULTISPECIES: SRPBCC family protein [Aliivibrio]|uniref:Ubiquinone-binding protein n=1 Tax=Aliivibrio finisterrensis TaxID=511998 RepID=A0A4Q5KV21_9GAMM|nr:MULTISPECIES: SRPBCC family protein [Aliivibrio]MDD9177900.1 SRPBCC family protein [Aliivibrio sp. A6]RYU52244.1 ubiquinone-binding protein [Aliivibrio finisterrensis]RYU53724.1 ubiquinone-binding protein [Aliivibrio finisterrensis]RYU58856.1 ubiquinone-binding protein [Aliivibrio finisterrensis]RYU60059.1 ubiquinone-binding protein [Aliivibrio finisterrensis]
MPQVSRSALVPFSAKQMYDLVNDVASYPQFLPGCSGSKIIEQSEHAMVASVDVAKAGIKKTFTTKNTLVDSEVIGMNLVNGPFKSLTGGWHFMALDETACKVELKLDFEFSNALVAMAFGKVFQELTNNMVNSFTQRAKQVYVSN